ncbi:MAG: hypothetical protein JXR97_13975 [Planctomycetes bacterium]|nr:hypothetical protein [Planctomycetota bacterium]
MNTDAALTFASGYAWYWIIAIAAITVMVIARAYPHRVRQLAGERWIIPATLRAVGTICLLLLVIQPELDITRNKTEEHSIVMLLDKSSSMAVKDSENGPSRLKSAALAANDSEEVIKNIPGLSLQIIPFADTVSMPLSGDDLLTLTPSGDESDISAPLKKISSIRPPVTRIILLSDGNDTTGLDWQSQAISMKIPVDTVVVGTDINEKESYRDLMIESLDHRDSVPVGSVTPIVANIDASGFAGKTVNISLKSGNEILARSELVLDGQKGVQPVTINFHPAATGLMDLSVFADPLPGEKFIENNSVSFPLAVHDKLPRVVYLEGTIRPEYKFLRRSLSTDPGIEFMSLVRIRGANFLRQGSIHGMELEGIPASSAEYAAIDVLVLGDISAESFGETNLKLLSDAVSKGMGLLLLSSPSTLGESSDYSGSAMASVFPAMPSGTVRPGKEIKSLFLTKDGYDHPACQNLRQFFGIKGKEPVKSLPALGGIYGVSSLRPTATVLLAADVSGNANMPVLVAMPYGRGRVLSFHGNDSWRWHLGMGGATGADPHAKFWGQAIRWLSGTAMTDPGDNTSFSVTASKLVARVGESITLSANVRNLSGEGALSISGEALMGEESIGKFGFTATPGIEGAYEGRFVSDRPGKIKLKVTASASEKEIASKAMDIRYRGGRGEFERMNPDRKALARVARESGGEAISLEDLTSQMASFADEARMKREIVHIPLWHGWLLFAFATILLSAEWLMRKRLGLP